ncbi:TIGR03915 family putative DNA repair protein [Hydrogenoanaerobacterium sp.]|uniref:TIGR03915 family putative DNA repair protein n=1 Tax=Hydrogenoanaerobacterium sp. TaxID=2953763 RepID=UPI00289BF0D2|nr:TIGR03915 family putative DNA repair protein [Hydrogenoanaerobacterium sp.]
MPDGAAIVYLYDGSLDGLMCCVFESYTRRETPIDIVTVDEPQGLLYPTREIITVAAHAQRIYASLSQRICADAEELVRLGFLTCAPDKALLIYRFICLGYRFGGRVMSMLTDDTVCALNNAVKSLLNERHLLTGFIRFSEYSGALVATIEPKNFVLPLLKSHFCSRFAEEHFMIYDAAHGMALTYSPYKANVIPVESLQLPEEDEAELQYRRLWKQYYDTIAIEARYNPKCRMTHMPKRYWAYMTEFQENPSARMKQHVANRLSAPPAK